jgi:hypothetical protein
MRRNLRAAVRSAPQETEPEEAVGGHTLWNELRNTPAPH